MWTDALRVVKEYLPHKVRTMSETKDQNFNQNG